MPYPGNTVALTNFTMRKIIFFLTISMVINLGSNAQTDPKLMERLNLVLKVTQEMDTEKILDLSYPKLFNIVPREAVSKALETMYSSEEFSITLDSLKTKTIHPIFSIADGQFAKITYSMLMRMKFNETLDSADVAEMLPEMEVDFGKGNIRFDVLNNTMIIKSSSELVAIKDEYAKDWCFVNYQADSELTTVLFSQDVIEKLKEYK